MINNAFLFSCYFLVFLFGCIDSACASLSSVNFVILFTVVEKLPQGFRIYIFVYTYVRTFL